MTSIGSAFVATMLAVRSSDAGPVLGSGSHAMDFASWGPIEWLGYSAMALVCIWVLWRAVVATMHPNEDAPDHAKRVILDGDALPPRLLRAGPPPAPPPVRS